MQGHLIPDRVAVLSRSFSKNAILRDELQAVYSHAKFNETGRTLAGDELIEFVAGHDGVIVALEKLDRAMLARMRGVRVLTKYGVGLDNVDLEAASELGMRLGWTAGVNACSVAELTIGFAISLLHLVPQLNREIHGGIFRQTMGRQLTSCSVGVVGCGHVGSEVVRLLRPFGNRVLVHDIRRLDAFCAEQGVEQVSLDILLRECDVVTLHLPATKATRMMFNADRLDQMRPNAVLVNTARGGIVDEAALKERLKSSRIASAAFDVFEPEPPRDEELLLLPNFIATPHIGGSSDQAILAMGRAAIAGLSHAIDPLEHLPDWAR
jgi:D-3-phosphoglycerate dehydrogenase